MIKNATTIRAIGFLLFILGLFTLITNMVGVDLVFMKWLYEKSVFASYAIRLGMVLIGMVLIFIGSTNFDRTEA